MKLICWLVSESLKITFAEIYSNNFGIFPSESIGKSVWIGAEVIGNGGNWIWVTTLLNVGWFNFAHGEPNDLNHYEGCMEITAQGAWADQCCVVAKPYLCERYV